MKKLSVIALAALLTLVGTRPAEATLFTLESYSVSLNGPGSSGLEVWAENLLPAMTSFPLTEVGKSYTVDLFRVRTNEGSLNWDDLVPKKAKVLFTFGAPLPGFGGTAEGISGALFLGYLAWHNPLTLAFGTGGLLNVSLSPVAFGLPGSATVKAKFTLARASSTAPVGVPEPSTLLLVGIGAAGAAWRARRRKA